MADIALIKQLLGATVEDKDGNKLGPVKEVFINDGNHKMDFVSLRHSMLNMGEALAPLEGHTLEGDKLTLPFNKDLIKECPAFSDAGFITPEEQLTFYRYYGLDNLAAEVESGIIPGDTEASTAKGTRGTQSQYGVLRVEERLEGDEK